MDDDVALYFPYSHVPQNAWFTKVLLYWDHAESIVAEEHPSRRSRTSVHSSTLGC